MTFKDFFGVEYSEDRQVLLKCTHSISGSYTVSPMVNTIGRGAFEGCNMLEELILPDGLKCIEIDAFKGCNRLSRIVLPNGLTTFKYPLFADCAIKKLVLPDIIDEHLGRMLIESCNELVEVEISNSNNSFCIDNGAVYSKDKTKLVFLSRNFEGCFVLPRSVKLVYSRAIRNCKTLQSIVLHDSFEGFTNTSVPLYGCSSLMSIEVDINNKQFCSFEGVLYSKNGTELLRCPEGKTGDFSPIPQVSTIKKSSFTHCEKLKLIAIPPKVVDIEEWAFTGDNLTIVFERFARVKNNTFLNAKVRIVVPTGTKQWFVNGGYPQECIVEDYVVSNVIKEQDKSLDCKGFAAIAGMEKLKQKLRTDIIKVLKDPNRARRFGITIPNGILLYGPPGCGKTFFAEKLAEEIGCNYMYVMCSDVASPYIHGGQGKIATMFNEARKNAPTLLFLDEVDAMITDRGKHTTVSESGEVNEFLAQLNNCGQDGVTVIAATNKPDLIDKAALRTGRLALHYYIPQPDFETRKQLFEINLKNRAVDSFIDYERLAQMTENYSCSDIREIVDNAGRIAFGSDSDCITQFMLESASIGLKSHLTLATIKKYEAIRDSFEKNT